VQQARKVGLYRHAAAKLARYPSIAFRWSRFAGFSLAESLAEAGQRRLAADHE
jgi:hypothetical protein